MEVQAEEAGEKVFSVNIGKPFKGSALVAAPGKLYLFIKIGFLLG
ncbi:hypothetical protein T07_4262 [Trichinella nelsoni]|uniref:Uncharacterized protein n=1 Tax=Trichinella nelsoni TaxID=6336 RepID=A0A0V0RE22_9BILA|nr:hypothetical protein T07_4262 [Trichinella nelsoni]